jgi:hypothetical protein
MVRRTSVVAAGLLAIGGAVAAVGGAAAQDQPPSVVSVLPADGARPGHGFVKSATVTSRRRLRIVLGCPAMGESCAGSFRVLSVTPLRPTACGPKRQLTIARGNYGPVVAGAQQSLSVPLTRQSRFYVLSHRRTAIAPSIQTAAGSLSSFHFTSARNPRPRPMTRCR